MDDAYFLRRDALGSPAALSSTKLPSFRLTVKSQRTGSAGAMTTRRSYWKKRSSLTPRCMPWEIPNKLLIFLPPGGSHVALGKKIPGTENKCSGRTQVAGTSNAGAESRHGTKNSFAEFIADVGTAAPWLSGHVPFLLGPQKRRAGFASVIFRCSMEWFDAVVHFSLGDSCRGQTSSGDRLQPGESARNRPRMCAQRIPRRRKLLQRISRAKQTHPPR